MVFPPRLTLAGDLLLLLLPFGGLVGVLPPRAGCIGDASSFPSSLLRLLLLLLTRESRETALVVEELVFENRENRESFLCPLLL